MKDSVGFELQFSIQGASALFRKSRLMAHVAERVRHMGKDQAYRAGIGPVEYDAILTAKLSSIDTDRLESLYSKLTADPA